MGRRRAVPKPPETEGKGVSAMTDTALFVGWGGTYPGREHHAVATFKEWIALLEEQKAAGEIERFEHVLLGPHGGELDGFTLVYGTPEKLMLLQTREEVRRLRLRAFTDHAKFSVIEAIIGEAVVREYEEIEKVVDELERELVPA
jgi:hypothetical protein